MPVNAMRTSSRVARWWPLLIVALVFAVGMVLTGRQLQTRYDDGRAHALSELLAVSTTPRMMDAPGVEAWLRTLLRGAADGLSGDAQLSMRRLIEPGDGTSLPWDGETLRDALEEVVATDFAKPSDSALRTVHDFSGQDAPRLRSVQIVATDTTSVVVTRRRSLMQSVAGQASESFVRSSAARLETLHRRWFDDPRADDEAARRLGGADWMRGWNPIRFYAISEDGTFVSLPAHRRNDPGLRTRLNDEATECFKRGSSPELASDAFMFSLAYAEHPSPRARYSGLYLDVAGAGVVGTLATPFTDPATGLQGLIAIDVSFELDLLAVTQSLDTTVQATVAQVSGAHASGLWRPWATLQDGLPAYSPPSLRAALEQQALRELRERTYTPRKSLVHAGSIENGETLFAVQVARSRWLLVWVPSANPPTPWGVIVAAPIVMLLIAGWLQWRQAAASRTVEEQARQLADRDGVLDAMRLPAIVVDPNDDTIVHANPAAVALGVKPGSSFREDILSDDAAARQHYRDMQDRGRDRFRSYGVPLRLRDTDGHTKERFAVIRSVSLDQPVGHMRAQSRHRLGLLLPVDDRDDLGLRLEARAQLSRDDERNKLAAILDHGVDTLARVLRSELDDGDVDRSAFLQWLSGYLQRRVFVTQWVLTHWGRPPLADQHGCVIEVSHLQATLAQYDGIARAVSRRPNLRARLHWNNGILAGGRPGERSAIDTTLDWPPDVLLPMPEDGVFGYVLGELVTNAIKYGPPGQDVSVVADWDPVRRQLHFSVSNALGGSAQPKRPGRAYGGLGIVQEIARLCDWTKFSAQVQGERFVVSWVCSATRRRPATIGD